jgi:hypothetical protein
LNLYKYDIVNRLGGDFKLSSFLEISSDSTGFCFDKVDQRIFPVKDILCYFPPEMPSSFHPVGRVDVAEEIQSYESQRQKIRDKHKKYDLVFVDPWHTYEQSWQDLETALECVSHNGFIVVHDCCPTAERLIGPYKKGAWCGQTYEAFIDFRYAHQDLDILCVNDDYGCGIISMSPRFFVGKPSFGYEKDKIEQWDYFNANKKELLHLVEPEEYEEILQLAKKLEPLPFSFLKKIVKWFIRP